MNEDFKALQNEIENIGKRLKSLDEKTVAPDPPKVTFESLASSEDLLKGVTKGRAFQTHQTASDSDQNDDKSFEALIKRSGL